MIQRAPLRQAVFADHATLLGLISEYYAYDGIVFRQAEISGGLEVLLGNPSLGLAFLIEQNTAVVGYTMLTFGFDLEFGGRQATVTDVYLRSAFRGAGLGTAVFAALESVCLELGIAALELQAEHNNTAALAFYGKLGFERHDRVPLSKRLIKTASSRL